MNRTTTRPHCHSTTMVMYCDMYTFGGFIGLSVFGSRDQAKDHGLRTGGCTHFHLSFSIKPGQSRVVRRDLGLQGDSTASLGFIGSLSSQDPLRALSEKAWRKRGLQCTSATRRNLSIQGVQVGGRVVMFSTHKAASVVHVASETTAPPMVTAINSLSFCGRGMRLVSRMNVNVRDQDARDGARRSFVCCGRGQGAKGAGRGVGAVRNDAGAVRGAWAHGRGAWTGWEGKQALGGARRWAWHVHIFLRRSR